MDIGDKHFNNKKSLEEYVRRTIEKIGICESMKTKGIQDYYFFIELFKRHPKYPEKIDNICDISIVKNKVCSKYLGLVITKNDGSVDDISWRDCISGKAKDYFKCALRISIDAQIKNFRCMSSNVCDICKTVDADEYHVDHENHFEEIVYNFLQTIQKDRPTLFQNTTDNRKSFTSHDRAYELEWQLFHKRNARLRILCRSCNLKRPKWRKETSHFINV